MYYRITTMSVTDVDAVGAYADSMRDRMKELNAVPVNTIDAGNGKMVMIAVYNSKSDADAAAPKAKEMLGGAGEMMTAPPSISFAFGAAASASALEL
jgi:hypothetical protein